MEKFGTQFQSFEGPTDGPNLKNARAVGLYFGADWCIPFKKFCPTLISFYEQINEDIHQFEIIYIGLDENEDRYKESIRDFPWLYYEWKEHIKYQIYLEYKQHVPGFPCLLIINPNNSQVITNQGRGMIEKEGKEAFQKWLTKMSFK
ncbi:hypothetical protein pb186bvf_019378 [Paramecium bursaria]